MNKNIPRKVILQWFADWAKLKPRIHFSSIEPTVFFRERQIWWASIGQNIGSEENGKHGNFERPVIIFKKFNPQTFLALPVSTTGKEGAHRLMFKGVSGKRFIVNLSQMRVLSSKRLLRLVGIIPTEIYLKLKEMYKTML